MNPSGVHGRPIRDRRTAVKAEARTPSRVGFTRAFCNDRHVKRARPTLVIGWREWVSLPALGVPTIKAKVDTGARSSSLHVFDVEHHKRGSRTLVRFRIHPRQRDVKATVVAEAEVVTFRHVRSSSGHRDRRPVIVTDVEIFGMRWPIEITLANRDAMGFRMLLGREAVRARFLVNPGSSYYDGRLAKRRLTSIRKDTT